MGKVVSLYLILVIIIAVTSFVAYNSKSKRNETQVKGGTVIKEFILKNDTDYNLLAAIGAVYGPVNPSYTCKLPIDN